jgi:hypothetical protein
VSVPASNGGATYMLHADTSAGGTLTRFSNMWRAFLQKKATEVPCGACFACRHVSRLQLDMLDPYPEGANQDSTHTENIYVTAYILLLIPLVPTHGAVVSAN